MSFKWMDRVAKLALIMVAVSTIAFIAKKGCEEPPPAQTKRCTHKPEPQPDRTTLCRSYEVRNCNGRECGPWTKQ